MPSIRIWAVLIASTLALSAASIEERLDLMQRHHPAADSDRDGRLSESEAMAYVWKVSGRKKNLGPARRFPEMFDLYEKRSFEGMGYRLMAPPAMESGKRYPLIVSLHGSGGIGDDNRSQLRVWNGLMSRAEWRSEHPAFVIAPQAAPGAMWGERTSGGELENIYMKDLIPVILDLLDALGREFPIDESRIYVLGASMGGGGTWALLQARPERFAAAIPVCPGRIPDDVSTLVGIPIWTFHGDADPRAPVENSRTVFERLRQAGGSIKYTELRGVGHSSWIQGFSYRGDDPERGYVTVVSSDKVDQTADVWEWLFRQRRGAR